ncbi:MAG: amino acid ABC transporter permease [Leucobacter sp.]
MTSTVIGSGVERSSERLSPAPNVLGVALAATVGSVLLLLIVGVLAGIVVPGTAFGLWFTILGFALAAICVFVALTALGRAVKSARLQRTGEVLEARAVSDGARERAFVSLGFTVMLLVVLAVIALITMNDAAVAKTFFQWELISKSALDVVKAFGVNIFIAVIAQVFVLILGLILAIGRMLPGKAGRPIRVLAITYIDVMRAVPAVIVLYLVGFGLPLAGIPFLSDFSPVWFAIVALTLTYSAYVAETFRVGIEQIHPSQSSASRSLGFSYAQTLRYVILPQAIRSVIPTLLTTFIALQKDTSLVNIIGTMDAFNQAKFYASSNFNLSSVTVVAILFVIITIPQTRVVDWMLERGNTARRGGAK